MTFARRALDAGVSGFVLTDRAFSDCWSADETALVPEDGLCRRGHAFGGKGCQSTDHASEFGETGQTGMEIDSRVNESTSSPAL